MTTDTSLLDDAWLQTAPRTRSRLRSLLVVLLLAGLVFLGGVEVQKRYGVAGGASLAAGGLPAGTPGSGPPSGGFGQQSGSSAAASPTAQTAVVGTLTKIAGNVWTVTDLGGTAHTITVGDSVSIVREKRLAAGSVQTGATVDVSGSTGTDGALSATTVTLR